MEKFTPYEKLSKKEKRKLNAAKRTTWDISPVTRRPENPKAYNRKKTHREFRDDYSIGASFYMLNAIIHWKNSEIPTPRKYNTIAYCAESHSVLYFSGSKHKHHRAESYNTLCIIRREQYDYWQGSGN